jgi:lipopolysaccharide export system permease protein
MRILPVTFSLYLSRQFLLSFAVIMVGLLSVVYVGEALELLRRSSAHPDVGFGLVLSMAGLKLPGTAQVILPSAMLFTALYFFWRMTRTHELEVARAAGVSVWNFLAPVALVALLLGVLEVTVVNPLGSAMIGRFERLEDRHFKNRPTTLDISSSGIWISQADSQGQAFIHAESLKPGTFTLSEVTVFENPSNLPRSRRIDAESAVLVPGAWELSSAYVHETAGMAKPVELFRLPTDLTQQKIEDSFASPKSMSFWQLPEFIHTLQSAGLSSVRHELYFQSLLAKPLLLAAMVVLAAVFGLRQARRGGIFGTIVSGLVLGLLLYVFNDVLQTFAQSGGMPVALAAWGPALVGLTAGAAALFHFEDG